MIVLPPGKLPSRPVAFVDDFSRMIYRRFRKDPYVGAYMALGESYWLDSHHLDEFEEGPTMDSRGSDADFFEGCHC